MDYQPTLGEERFEVQVGSNQLIGVGGGGTIMPWERVRSTKFTFPSKQDLIIIGSATVIGILVIIVFIIF